MDWIVYILRCADDSFYTGITKDMQRRLAEHNNDNRKGSRYTRSRRPVDLIYQEECSARSSASQREHYLKQLSRSQKLRLIEDCTAKTTPSHNMSTCSE